MILDARPDHYLSYVDGFLSAAEIAGFIAVAREVAGDEPAGVRQSDGTYRVIPDYRRNKRGNRVDDALAARMLDRSREHLPPVVRGRRLARFHPNFKFYRYERGDFFDWHKDGSLREGDECSLVTWMIYLTRSGLTKFEGHPEIAAEPGRLVVFNHKLFHRSPPLDSDVEKLVMRTDVMYGPPDEQPVAAVGT